MTYDLFSGASAVSCFSTTAAEYDEKCHIYSHVYNNLIRDSHPYHNDGNFLYSDQSSGRNTFENNVMYGTGSMALREDRLMFDIQGSLTWGWRYPNKADGLNTV